MLKNITEKNWWGGEIRTRAAGWEAALPPEMLRSLIPPKWNIHLIFKNKINSQGCSSHCYSFLWRHTFEWMRPNFFTCPAIQVLWRSLRNVESKSDLHFYLLLRSNLAGHWTKLGMKFSYQNISFTINTWIEKLKIKTK